MQYKGLTKEEIAEVVEQERRAGRCANWPAFEQAKRRKYFEKAKRKPRPAKTWPSR